MGHTGVGLCEVGWAMQGWVGHVVKQPKNDIPQNQDLTPPKSFLKGVQCFLPKQLPKNPSPTLFRKQLTIIFQKKRQNT